jgi:hypothetical protein
MLWVDRVGDHRSSAILARPFSVAPQIFWKFSGTPVCASPKTPHPPGDAVACCEIAKFVGFRNHLGLSNLNVEVGLLKTRAYHGPPQA